MYSFGDFDLLDDFFCCKRSNCFFLLRKQKQQETCIDFDDFLFWKEKESLNIEFINKIVTTDCDRFSFLTNKIAEMTIERDEIFDCYSSLDSPECDDSTRFQRFIWSSVFFFFFFFFRSQQWKDEQKRERFFCFLFNSIKSLFRWFLIEIEKKNSTNQCRTTRTVFFFPAFLSSSSLLLFAAARSWAKGELK